MITDEAMLQAIDCQMHALYASYDVRDGHIYCAGNDMGTISEVYHLPHHRLVWLVNQCKVTMPAPTH